MNRAASKPASVRCSPRITPTSRSSSPTTAARTGRGEIVAGIAREDQRLRLVTIDRLPEGWYGKNNAMQTAIAGTKGEYICMIDADCRQLSNRTLATAIRYAQDHQADLLSVLPVLEMKGFWENVIQPVCSGVMMIWFARHKVNNPAKPNAYANGAFMLIRREAYEAIGTHEAIRDKINEDMHLAARVKGAGRKLVVVRSTGLYIVRMYTSLPQIYRGWSRIFFGCFGTLRRLVISFVLMFTAGLAPYVAAAAGLLAAPDPVAWACAAAGLAAIALQLSAIFRYYRLAEVTPGLFWTYPLGCAITLVILVNSMLRLRAGATVVWKSTTYTKSMG
ncbi:MAG: glycosyltransferase [Planctomycetota bacterium]|nr:glycosyltransferase [Planctomycetota bacterium]